MMDIEILLGRPLFYYVKRFSIWNMALRRFRKGPPGAMVVGTLLRPIDTVNPSYALAYDTMCRFHR